MNNKRAIKFKCNDKFYRPEERVAIVMPQILASGWPKPPPIQLRQKEPLTSSKT